MPTYNAHTIGRRAAARYASPRLMMGMTRRRRQCRHTALPAEARNATSLPRSMGRRDTCSAYALRMRVEAHRPQPATQFQPRRIRALPHVTFSCRHYCTASIRPIPPGHAIPDAMHLNIAPISAAGRPGELYIRFSSRHVDTRFLDAGHWKKCAQGISVDYYFRAMLHFPIFAFYIYSCRFLRPLPLGHDISFSPRRRVPPRLPFILATRSLP